MTHCTACGAIADESQQFCASCGRPLSPAPSQSRPVLPPPSAASATAVIPRVDLTRILAGNWLGSGVVALVALVTAGFFGAILALLLKPEGFGVGNTLTLATWIANAAFGADLTASVHVDGADGSLGIGLFPLTLTAIVLVLSVVLFRRLVRDYPSPGVALGDAARTALIFGVGLMVPALIFRSDNEELGDGPVSDLSEAQFGAKLEYGASVAGSLFLGFLIMFVVLALAVFLRRDWWSARVRQFHDWLAAPLYGYAVMFALLPIVGLAGYLLLSFGEDTINENDPTDDDSTILATVFALLGNGGVWVLGLGSGASFGGEGSTQTRGGLSSAEDDSGSAWEHLWGRVTEDEPGLWASPVIMFIVLALSAYVVKRSSPNKERVLSNLLVWALGLLVFVPLLVRLSGAHIGGEISEDNSTYEGTAYGGIHGLQATFSLFFAGLIVALGVAAFTRSLDVRRLRQQITEVAGRFQTHPARPAPDLTHSPPAGAPPTGPPPTAPPPPG